MTWNDMQRAIGNALGWVLVVLLMPLVFAAVWVSGFIEEREQRRINKEKGRSFRPPPPLDDDWRD